MTVEQFVMLLTSQSIMCSEACGKTNPYRYCTPIPRIYCKDGESISVQAHGGVHCKFLSVQRDDLGYSKNFGHQLLRCETDSVNLNQYGSDNIEDVEEYVTSHGGIDIQVTMEHAVTNALKAIEKAKRREQPYSGQ